MTNGANLSEEDDLFAAELAFGLLEADAAIAAQRRAEVDAGFAATCQQWDRVAAAGFTTTEELPRPSIWGNIQRRIARDQGLPAAGRGSRRAVRAWQAATALVSLVAAALLLVVAYRPMPSPHRNEIAAAPTVVALLAGKTTRGVVAISYNPVTGEITLVPSRLPLAGGTAELWVVPTGASPVAVGLVPALSPGRLAAHPLARRFLRAGATFAVSVEPIGGSPTGAPTGPVILTGEASSV